MFGLFKRRRIPLTDQTVPGVITKMTFVNDLTGYNGQEQPGCKRNDHFRYWFRVNLPSGIEYIGRVSGRAHKLYGNLKFNPITSRLEPAVPLYVGCNVLVIPKSYDRCDIIDVIVD